MQDADADADVDADADADADDVDHAPDVRSGWGQTLVPGRRPVLLCVDMVGAYFDPGGVFELPSHASLRAAARLQGEARRAGVRVVHTCVRFARDASDAGVFGRKVGALRVFADDGSPEHAAAATLRPEVAPEPGETVVVKQMPSAFFGTSLAGTLTAAGVDTVVLCGVSTSGCVRASAVDAMSHGFVPLVVADACGDRDPRVHRTNLHDLATKYAEVVDESAAAAYLRSVAGAQP